MLLQAPSSAFYIFLTAAGLNALAQRCPHSSQKDRIDFALTFTRGTSGTVAPWVRAYLKTAGGKWHVDSTYPRADILHGTLRWIFAYFFVLPYTSAASGFQMFLKHPPRHISSPEKAKYSMLGLSQLHVFCVLQRNAEPPLAPHGILNNHLSSHETALWWLPCYWLNCLSRAQTRDIVCKQYEEGCSSHFRCLH